MPMMYGFAAQRKQLLEVELERLSIEMPPLGAMRVSLTGDLAVNRVTPETALELVVIQATDQPFRRRADFWTTHLRPRLDTSFFVYTPEEYEELVDTDPLLMAVERDGEVIIG
ncbi:MAG TPA: hypothetical protein QGI07_02780 [Dehalococcoidia bacterium]|nr:hypothetical protein [Chloroflexota bacterium]MDP5877514.1 hypothetical protein [Dehalococcoidia bacterium]MDP7159806.1 hypothetical protein [Dehalococcoidia bacterium]MDP7212735.1 hypothetical protein [Dehalococcoidia bacterium]MDP7513329.1 hypothetical protein [Dehalococcoidia bacterium]